MANLIKQTRARFTSGQLENRDESNETRARKITSESQSSREKKRGQSWIKRQFSRRKSPECDLTSDHDYQIAVAAAACAIQSLEEKRRSDDKDRSHGTASKHDPKSSNKSKKEDSVNQPQPRKSALKSSGHQEVVIERPSHQRPIIRPSTSVDRQLLIAEGKTPVTPVPKPNCQPTPLPRAQSQSVIDAIRQTANKSSIAYSQADAWEKQEIASMKERYEKTKARIDDWENKKKEHAKRKIERIEAELYKKRVKCTQSHRLDIKVIEGIAEGARTQAAENMKNEEFNIEGKTNKIRATGKLPHSSFCF